MRRHAALFLLTVLLVLCVPSLARAEIRVCVRPPDVAPNVNEWAYSPGAKAMWTTRRAKFTLKSQGLTTYVFDPYAPPASAKLLPIPHNKLTCPTPPPRPMPAPAKDAPKASAEEDKAGASTSAEASETPKPPPAKDEQVDVVPPGVKMMPERPPEEPRPSPPPPEGVLSNEPLLPSESTLPKKDEVHPPKCVDEHCTLVDRGGALPELQHRQGRPLVSAVPCEQTKEGCNGNGKGKAKPLTPLERMVRELTIASAMLNGEFNHDLARKDGKRFGIIGGDNEDGVDNAIVQAAAAITQVASAVLVGQAEKFAKKLEEACAKKAPIILEGAEKVSKETAELLATQYGRTIADALEQNGALGPYKVMREFTRGLEGDYQAHHILEKAMASRWGLTKELDEIPSVILTSAEHKRITKLLDEARERFPKTKKGLWQAYEDVYKDVPHWLAAIKPYFRK
ncbi:hypothetical protein [Polyangium jinanense]|uniref:Uncharacterized protein n=1 Tax=Polyangium jinanense TaxID=2829994 RepID=A0A9X4AZH8_9BACT|nr:hypothetical protein [Polyangium jinanense]MDC3988192.1 hypothetical protein [Polyangium jinanense]